MNKEVLIVEMREVAYRGIISDELIDKLAEVAMKHLPQWVSVEDRLPELSHKAGNFEYSDYVILEVYDNQKKSYDYFTAKYEIETATGHAEWYIPIFDDALLDVPKRWQPLPEPPKQ